MLRQDLRYALRTLTHSRGYASWVVGSLAIGMAVTIAALAVLNATMVLPFPEVIEQKRLARVSVNRNCGRPDCWIRMSSPEDYVALREGLHGVQGLAAYAAGEIAVALPEARSMRSLFASANYFELLGVRPVIGRVFDANDEERDAAVAVIAHSTWTRELNGDPAVIGRSIRVADRQQRPQVAVVNQTFAQSSSGATLGSMLRVAPHDHDLRSAIDVRIVGIIEPAREPRYEPDSRPAPKVYLPSPLEPEPTLALYLRTRTSATALAQPVRELVSRIAPRVPLQEIGSLEELNERSYATQLWLARAAAFLGVIGLLLATAELYGVSSYVVAMRSREIAIRIAVGARPRAILAMVLGQSMRVAAIGLLVGGCAAVVVSRVIQSEYHGIVGIDGVAFAGAAALFLAAMFVASAIPAVRASRVDPIENLRDA